jgi:hypothetical protein
MNAQTAIEPARELPEIGPSRGRQCADCSAPVGRRSFRCIRCHGSRVGSASIARLNAARPAGSASRVAAANLRWGRTLAWCPIEYRDEYRRFRVSKRFLAHEAREAVEALIAVDLKRYRLSGELQQAKRRGSGRERGEAK